MKKAMTLYKFSSPIYSVKIGMLLVSMLLSFFGCERIHTPVLPDASTPPKAAQPLTVMTYNVYVGVSMEKLLAITNLIEVPTAVANVYEQAIASDFPSRAAAIAKSIKTHQPHLIGLQEISVLRRQSPGDRLAGGEIPAEDVILDYLDILMNALENEGQAYVVAAKVANFDVEMPMFTADSGIDDVRLTDFDVILARSDVAFSDITQANYTHTFRVDRLFLEVKRGYAAVDATVNGFSFRFVNTHLESFEKQVRIAQTQELIASLADETLPIVLLGDFNSPAPDGEAYQLLLEAAYIDIWQMGSDDLGNTCCQDPGLENPNTALFERIDQIFICNRLTPTTVQTQVLADRLPDGRWASDHAGVLARLFLE